MSESDTEKKPAAEAVRIAEAYRIAVAAGDIEEIERLDAILVGKDAA